MAQKRPPPGEFEECFRLLDELIGDTNPGGRFAVLAISKQKQLLQEPRKDVAPEKLPTGVGGQIRGVDGEIWGMVTAEEGKVWWLESGRIAKKETMGVKWNWSPYFAGVGGLIRGVDGEVWSRVANDEGHCWRLESGRIAKKETEGIKWNWSEEVSPQAAALQTDQARKTSIAAQQAARPPPPASLRPASQGGSQAQQATRPAPPPGPRPGAKDGAQAAQQTRPAPPAGPRPGVQVQKAPPPPGPRPAKAGSAQQVPAAAVPAGRVGKGAGPPMTLEQMRAMAKAGQVGGMSAMAKAAEQMRAMAKAGLQVAKAAGVKRPPPVSPTPPPMPQVPSHWFEASPAPVASIDVDDEDDDLMSGLQAMLGGAEDDEEDWVIDTEGEQMTASAKAAPKRRKVAAAAPTGTSTESANPAAEVVESVAEVSTPNKKIMYLMRGPPGCGKSTAARALLEKHLQAQGFMGALDENSPLCRAFILSTDDYFTKVDEETGDATYDFQPRDLGVNHKKNLQRCTNSVELAITPLIIDNTNASLWEMRAYVDLAEKNGYDVRVIDPRTLNDAAFDVDELMQRCQERSQKTGKTIPRQVVERMVNNFQELPETAADDVSAIRGGR